MTSEEQRLTELLLRLEEKQAFLQGKYDRLLLHYRAVWFFWMVTVLFLLGVTR